MVEQMAGQFDLVHTLQTEGSGTEFEIAITGAELATTALIMVHGFGVSRDSRGLFTELGDASKYKAITIRGDFSDVQTDATIAVPFSEQKARLEAIIDFSRDELKTVLQTCCIGHSQ